MIVVAQKIFPAFQANGMLSISCVYSTSVDQAPVYMSDILYRHFADYVHLPVKNTSFQEQSRNSVKGHSLFPVLRCGMHWLMTLNQLSQLTPSNDFLKFVYLKMPSVNI